MYRIIGLGALGAQELNNIFQPTTGGVGQFIVRLVDKTGHTQFLATCPGTPTGVAGTDSRIVLVIPQTPVQTAQPRARSGASPGTGPGRWSTRCRSSAGRSCRRRTSPRSTRVRRSRYSPSPRRRSIRRSTTWCARTSTRRPAIAIAATTEIVAEYAVDLEFAFSVDTGTRPGAADHRDVRVRQRGATRPGRRTSSPSRSPAIRGPQRIRSVRVRLVTRTARAGPHAHRSRAEPDPGRSCTGTACVPAAAPRRTPPGSCSTRARGR